MATSLQSTCLAKTRYYEIISRALIACIITSSVIGCDNPSNSNSNKPVIQIFTDKVVVDSSLILDNNPERYQPSYNLNGTLIPIQQKDISVPYIVYNPSLLIKQDEWVVKNQPLLTVDSYIDENEIATQENNFIDLVNESVNTLREVLPDNALSSDESLPVDSSATKVSIAEPSNSELSNPANNESDETQLKSKHLVASNNNESAQQNESKPQSTVVNSTDNINNPSAHDTTSVASSDANSNNETNIENVSTKNLDESHDRIKRNHPQHLSDNTFKSSKTKVILTLKSPIEGQVIHIHNALLSKTEKTNNTSNVKMSSNQPKNSLPEAIKQRKAIASNLSLFTIADTRTLQLAGKLPLLSKSQLSIGQPVKFNVYDANAEFSGQISHIDPHSDGSSIVVRATVISTAENQPLLKSGMHALMTIDYGQIELGVRVPRHAIHEANLSKLNKTHTRSINPIYGYVWVIGQDQHLHYTKVEVVEYFAKSDQFLVNGIDNNSLICLADLPISSDGLKISIY